jgi:tetratricopeptide (TPR) repeat protein
VLPLAYFNPLISGPRGNTLYAYTNSAYLNPTNGILMVARLDGPTAEIAKGLVDKALQAEREGLWGRAYFDARGVTNHYKLGDDIILGAEKTAARHGFETTLDKTEAVFPPGFPLSHIGLYVGWYEFNVAGAMAQAKLEFMPGAFAYHLHSYSAQTIRNPNERWVGPLLARGATCTMGCTEEPYLEGTPDVSVFIARWLFLGYSFGEAAYTSQKYLSWQTTVVGDPLYRPFSKKPQEQHEELAKAKSKLIEWSFLRVANINLATQITPNEVAKFLEREVPETKTSAVLSEKAGDLLKVQGKWIDAMEPYERALKLDPSPQQRLRISLTLASLQTSFSKEKEAYAIYQGLLRDFPDYPDKLRIYQKILPLADQFGKPGEAEEYQKALKELTPAPETPKP